MATIKKFVDYTINSDKFLERLYITSDLHFNHLGILGFECSITSRPCITLNDMNEYLIEKWNSVVPKNGIVIHNGDFMFPKRSAKGQDGYMTFEYILERLNGEIIFIDGNHDDILRNVIPSEHRHKLLDLFVKTESLRKHVVFGHFPMQQWNKKHYGSIHLHGHSHGRKVDGMTGAFLDVGFDKHGRVLTLREAIEMAQDVGDEYKSFIHPVKLVSEHNEFEVESIHSAYISDKFVPHCSLNIKNIETGFLHLTGVKSLHDILKLFVNTDESEIHKLTHNVMKYISDDEFKSFQRLNVIKPN